jgi:DNA-binding transcriptional MerR regulator
MELELDTELISKKELLDLTGISYGQLYRWKRKNIIPEDWFIKKSSFTGQETFFPREKILSRIDKIKNMKDNLSLDDIAGMVSSNPVNVVYSKEEIIKRNIVAENTLNNYVLFQNYNEDYFNFDRLLYLYILDRVLKSGEMNLDEVRLIIKTLEENYAKYSEKDCELIFIRKFGVPVCFLTNYPNEINFENEIKYIYRAIISNCIEELKILLNIKD